MKAALVSRQPDSPGREYALEDGLVTVGRSDDNTIVIDSSLVSRRHARIGWDGAVYLLEDLGSRNGTWVNDLRVHGSVAIHHGDIVRFGDATFGVQTVDDATRTIEHVAAPHETVTVLFVDMQGHTALFEELGSDIVYGLLDQHLSLMRECVTSHGGRTVKTEGDGLIASFSSVRQCVDCAVAIQRGLREVAHVGEDRAVPVRIGINSGEALRQADDLIGLAVIKAARVMSEARGGQIFISEVSRSLLGTASNLRIVSKGWHALKGISRKEHIYEIVWQ